MNSAYIYLQLYRLFDECTPIAADCGQLCGSACCRGDEDDGMYLFPGESGVYKLLSPDWVRIEPSDFCYEYAGKSYNVPIALCKGECDRYQRPLACRIFPLTPYISDDGRGEIRIDPRSRRMCPMGRVMELEDFEPSFVRNVKKAFTLLAKNKQVYAFLQEYTKYLKEFERFL